jgi:hypothetical protein
MVRTSRIAAPLLVAGFLTGCTQSHGETVTASGAAAPLGRAVGAASAAGGPPTGAPNPAVSARPGSYCALHPSPDYCKPAARPSPAAPGERVYEGFGVRSAPAPANASPKISRDQALATAAADDSYGQVETANPRAELRLYTDGDFSYDPVQNPNPASNRHFDHQMVWFVTYFDTRPAHLIAPPGQTIPPSSQELSCDVNIVIDANTGALIDRFQHCPGTPADQR